MLNKLSAGLKIYMPIVVLAFAALALFAPQTCIWIQTSWVNPLLMVVMFGMGLTMKPQQFIFVFAKPRDVCVGVVAQYVIMPALAFAIGRSLGLETGLLAGLVLVGTCPGGTASDVMTYLAKGDVALSMSVTAVNTLLAPILTPLITLLLLETTVSVDTASMFLSILQIVIAPIALGLFLGHFFSDAIERVQVALPLVSVVAICLIMCAIVSHNAEQIMKSTVEIFASVILLNLLGYGAGWLVGKAFGMTPQRRSAMSLEVGMQNSGMATSLAMTAFPSMALATVPGAIFGVWHNISGSLLAAVFRHFDSDEKREQD